MKRFLENKARQRQELIEKGEDAGDEAVLTKPVLKLALMNVSLPKQRKTQVERVSCPLMARIFSMRSSYSGIINSEYPVTPLC